MTESSFSIERLRQNQQREWQMPGTGTTLVLPKAFGFCTGVRSAVQALEKTLQKAKGQRVWLLGAMIHNPDVNARFLQMGATLLPSEDFSRIFQEADPSNDLFVIPAFGLPLEQDRALRNFVRDSTQITDGTCAFVRRIWDVVKEAGEKHSCIFIHGKARHQESEAILSRARQWSPAAVILTSPEDARRITKAPYADGCPEFSPEASWTLVCQTTMLQSETREVAEILRNCSWHTGPFQEETTICPATRTRQSSAEELCRSGVEIILVLGGTNSSNTTGLYRLAVQHLGADCCFFVENAKAISPQGILHYSPDTKTFSLTPLSELKASRIGILAGASCPDSVIEKAVEKLWCSLLGTV